MEGGTTVTSRASCSQPPAASARAPLRFLRPLGFYFVLRLFLLWFCRALAFGYLLGNSLDRRQRHRTRLGNDDAPCARLELPPDLEPRPQLDLDLLKFLQERHTGHQGEVERALELALRVGVKLEHQHGVLGIHPNELAERVEGLLVGLLAGTQPGRQLRAPAQDALLVGARPKDERRLSLRRRCSELGDAALVGEQVELFFTDSDGDAESLALCIFLKQEWGAKGESGVVVSRGHRSIVSRFYIYVETHERGPHCLLSPPFLECVKLSSNSVSWRLVLSQNHV